MFGVGSLSIRRGARRCEIEPAQEEIVRRIFADFLAGKAPGRIAKDLNAERIPAPLDDSARTDAVRTQAEAVARLVDAVAAVGISPALASRLKAEDAALNAVRKQIAKLRVRAAAVLPDGGAEEAKGWLRALVSDVGMKDPDRLRATFARAFGPLVLTPSAEGYRVAGNIKAPEIRAGSGGLSPSNGSCGGGVYSKADLLPFTRAIVS